MYVYMYKTLKCLIIFVRTIKISMILEEKTDAFKDFQI